MSSPGTLRFAELASSPAAPPSGYCIIYSKTDNVLYLKDSSNVEVALGSASSITALTGDVSATGPGSAAATVNSVGGALAAAIATAASQVAAATSSNTINTLVIRDASGNFSAGTITASLTGAASLNVLKTGDTMTGALNVNTSSATALVVDTNVLLVNGTTNRVGINQSSPSEALDVVGNATISGSVTASNISGTNTGDVTLTAVGASPSANAATLSGQALTLQPADATHPGVVTISAQTFGGTKTLNNDLVVVGATTLATSLTGPVKAASGVISTAAINLASEVTGTLPIGNGGTGQTTANTALNALLPSQATNTSKFLQTDGSNSSWQNVPAGMTINGDGTTATTLTTGTTGTDFAIVDNLSGDHKFNLPVASGTNTGKLSNTDWTTFNNKENAITATTSADYYRGDKTFQTLNTLAVPEVTNLYFTDERAQDAVGTILTDTATIDFTYNDGAPSITADVINSSITNSKLANMADNTVKGNKSGGAATPTDLTLSDVTEATSSVLTISNGTKSIVQGSNLTIEVKQSTTSQSGYLSSTDWNTFNNKENAITATTSADYYRGDKTFQTLNTAAVPEVTNLYFTDERAQDAVGGILTDTATIDFTYNDAGNQITADVIANSITDSKIRQSAGLSVLGRSTNSTGNIADITAGTDNYVLRRSGTTIDFGLLVNANIDAAAAISRSKTASGTAYRVLVNDSSGVMSENAAITASRAVASDANGQLVASTTTATELGYVNGTTSNIQKQVNTVFAVTDAANIATDASLGTLATVTLGGNRTLDTPTNPTDGKDLEWEFTQDGSGSRTITLSSGFVLGTTINAVNLSTAAGKIDYMKAKYRSSTGKWHVLALAKGY